MRFQRQRTSSAAYIVTTLGVVGLLGSCVLSACANKAKSPQTAHAKIAKAPSMASAHVRGIRLFPPLRDSDNNVFAVDRDGRKRIIAYGLRLIEEPGGSLLSADEYLPIGRKAEPLELPERLGGGFLFYVHSSSSTLLWKAKTWTDKLVPFANLDFELERIVPGFDRIYVLGRRASDWIALDAQTGESLDLGSLPKSPSYGNMAFYDAWFGAVEVPYRGLLVSFDAGTSWRPLELNAQSLLLEDDGLTIATSEGRYALDATGLLRRRDNSEQSQPLTVNTRLRRSRTATPEVRLLPEGPLGREPLRKAVLHGFPDSEETAIVASGGSLSRVRLRDGKVLATRANAYTGSGDCHALRVGAGFGFVCGDARGQTSIYEFSAPLELERVLAFDEVRYVAESGNGALVIRGACQASNKETGAYCIRTREGILREVLVRGDRGVERVVALRDGRTAVLIPPRLGAPGLLTLIDANSGAKSLNLRLPEGDAAMRALLDKGLWLDGFVETEHGELAGWVIGNQPFVGVRVALDGKVSVGRPETGVDRALFSGERAFVMGRAGLAAETTNGGFDWHDVDLPNEADLSERTSEARKSPLVQGCSLIGCVFADWVRVGYRDDGSPAKLAIAEIPDSTRLRSPGGGRWTMTCAPTGEISSQVLPLAPRRTRRREVSRTPNTAPGVGSEELVSTAWLPFREAAAPDLGADEIGFDTGADTDLVAFRAYAWGPRGADWNRVGKFQLRVADRFSLSDGVWSSSVSQSPWPDAENAAEIFGFDASAGPSSWRVVLEPSGRAGAMLVSARGTLDLILFEEGRAITLIANAGRFGLSQLSGVVRLGSHWYVGSYGEARTFRITRIEGTRVDLIGEYRDSSGYRALGATLVRNQRADTLGIWVRGTGFYVFPVDRETGRIEPALEIAPPALAKLPRPCASGDDGFLLEGQIPIEPYADFIDVPDGVTARGFEARFIAGPSDICVDSLAAQGEGLETTLRASSQLSNRPSVPLVITERPGGRRFRMRCSG